MFQEVKILCIARRPRRAHEDEDTVINSGPCAVVKTKYSFAVLSQWKYVTADSRFLLCTEHVSKHKGKLNIVKKLNHCS
jgi:hypothetical protein